MLKKFINNNRIYFVICYDISYTKIRNKIVKELEFYGFRVQKSVFELFLYQDQFDKLKKRIIFYLNQASNYYIKNNIDNKDSIKFYILSKNGEAELNNKIIGLGKYETLEFNEIIIK